MPRLMVQQIAKPLHLHHLAARGTGIEMLCSVLGQGNAAGSTF